ncbi:nostrin-like [Centruroides sculpturatus]|uniref:nostrin-like n=1 Tax=Centruroides sculpturatus TaxID=218467 RepID=UPI000C6D733D|nr:nostrin-like [Centruroides sculpturatus]
MRMTSMFKDNFWGSNGFDELRKYIKQGADFNKEIASVLQERSELEATYAKGLLKLANKIGKITRDGNRGSNGFDELRKYIKQGADFNKEIASVLQERNVAAGLCEDVVKPLKNIIEAQHKTRKLIESTVDKSAKTMADRRNDEQKTKHKSYLCSRENERLQEQAIDAKASRGKVLTEKDINKLETKRRKAEEAQSRADQDYYMCCVRAERSRQEWESSVYRASNLLQQLEEERMTHMHDLIQKYVNHLSVVGPKKVQICERLNTVISYIDVSADLQMAVKLHSTGPNVPEQLLPDFFAEDVNNNMKKERRKESLEKFLRMLKHDLELERKGKQGLENLAKVFQETPNFGDADAQQDVNEKLQHLRTMLIYLEASRYKLQCCLADLNGQQRPSHPLSSHFEQFRDKQGMTHTILKVPHWVKMERRNSDSSTSMDSDIPDCDYYSFVPNDIQVNFNHHLFQICERLNTVISYIDVSADLQMAVKLHSTGPNVPEQLLPDFFAEDVNNNMKKERRKESLEKFLRMLKHDLELERKGKQGLENLAKVFQETPNFGDADAQQDVNEKLQHLRTMLIYLEASRYKLQCCLADLNGQQRPSHPLSSHFEQFRDKQGMTHTILKVPHWVKMERRNSDSSTSMDSDIPDCDYYSFVPNDIQGGSDQIYANLPFKQPELENQRHPSQYKALYNYQAKLSDELSLQPGDIITVLKTADDGWWQGELRGTVGMFPSTYVTEIK